VHTNLGYDVPLAAVCVTCSKNAGVAHTYTGYIHEELYDDENLLVGHRFKKLTALIEKER
jgi:hypothetical protein